MDGMRYPEHPLRDTSVFMLIDMFMVDRWLAMLCYFREALCVNRIHLLTPLVFGGN
jgi:hypothetical protein